MIISSSWFIIALALFVAAGLGIMVFFIRGLRESLQARLWTQAQGRILQLHRELDHGEDLESHEIKVTYKYQVDGNEYTGTRISPFYKASCDLDVQHQLKQKLANAAQVTVYYKPGKPQCSMLAPGFHAGAFTGIGVGVIIVGFGLLALLLDSSFKAAYIQAIQVVQP